MPRPASYPRVYFQMVLAGFTLNLAMGLSASFLPILALELDPTGMLVGSVISAWFLARVFVEVPSGFLSDRIGKRELIIFGLVLAVVGAAICALSRSIYQLILGRALWGLGCAFYFTIDMSLIMDLFDSSRRATAVGTFQSIEFIGSFVGAPLGAYIAVMFGFYSTFYLATFMTFLSFLVVLASRDLKRVTRKHAGFTAVPVREIISDLRSWGLFAVCFCMFSRMLVEQGVKSTVFQLYLNQILSYDIATIGLLITARTATFSIGTLISGRLFNRLGKSVLMIGLLLNALCIYLYVAVNSLTSLLLISLVEGIGSSMASVALVVLLPEFVGKGMRGTAIGLYRTYMDLGGIFGPILFMFSYNFTGPGSPFLIAAGLLAANVVLIKSIRMNKNRKMTTSA